MILLLFIGTSFIKNYFSLKLFSSKYIFSGKTVEVNNTDAEGRLVLGDGVSYASRVLGCDIIIDMATLTGGQSITTGSITTSSRIDFV